jgi:hypothetical protein
VSNVRLRTVEFYRLFETKELMKVAGTAEFLVDLAAGRTGAAGAASTKDMFHAYLLRFRSA